MDTSVEKSDDKEVDHIKTNSYKLLLDSDSSEEEVEKEEKPVNKKIISSSDSNESDQESHENYESIGNITTEEKQAKNRRKNACPKKKIIVPKVQRKSAAKALGVIKEKMSHHQHTELKTKIQSEKQRMIREQEIRVPYHKPKQYSLKEFLARRTLHKPSSIEQLKSGGTGVSTIIAMKLASQNIEQFAQKMKEREEEAIEFFKSESESDSNDDLEEENENKENITSNPPNPSLVEITEPKGAIPNEISYKLELGSLKANENETTSSLVENIISGTDLAKENDVSSEFLDKGSIAGKDDFRVNINKNLEEDIETDIKQTTGEELSPVDKDIEFERLRIKYKNIDSTVESTEDRTENIIPEEAIDVKPKFSLKTLDEMASADCIINLETGKIEPRKLTGPEILFKRYMQTIQKPKHKDSVELNILSVENGKLENQKIEVKLDNEVELDHNRPGYSHELLKQQLRDQIVNKRIEEMKKKIKVENDINELEPEDKSEKEEWAEHGETEEEVEEESEAEMSVEEDEDDEEMKSRKKSKPDSCAFLDEEAVDEDDSGNEEESDDESSEEEIDETPSTAPKKGRIFRAFVDSDDEEQERIETPTNAKNINEEENTSKAPQTETIPTQDETQLREMNALMSISTPRDSENAFSTQPSDFTFTEPSVSEEMKMQDIKAICDQAESQMIDDDLLEICSGQFESTTQADPSDFVEPSNISQDPSETEFISQVLPAPDVNSTELLLKSDRKFLESSDDEVEAEIEKKHKKKKKRKKPVKKLGFSDDEEDLLDIQPENVSENEACEEEEEYVEPLYDSEENEIEEEDIEQTSREMLNHKERVKAAGKYLEDEAELSESEWGSADEDEKDMDKFDIELGDEDEFDQNQLQEEVGRIHARKLLDDDIRNVKKIEELLFEDEEIDGVGRERKFFWKNQDKNFPLQDENARDGDELEEDDFEEEVAWRKMRHERETMLSEQSQNLTESDKMSEEILLLDHNSQVTSSSVCSFSRRKFNVVKTPIGLASTTIDAKIESPFLIKAASLKKYQKSSFLSRDEATLTKIARFVSNRSANDEISNMSSNNTSNSMSFMTVEKSNENKKRKSDGKGDQEPSKKRKIETKHLLLDQLF